MDKNLTLYDAFDLSCFVDYTNCRDFAVVYAASYASSIVQHTFITSKSIHLFYH